MSFTSFFRNWAISYAPVFPSLTERPVGVVFYINDSCGSGGGGSCINRGEEEAADKLRPRCLSPFPAYFNSLLSIQQTHSPLQRKGEKINKLVPLQKSKKPCKTKKNHQKAILQFFFGQLLLNVALPKTLLICVSAC